MGVFSSHSRLRRLIVPRVDPHADAKSGESPTICIRPMRASATGNGSGHEPAAAVERRLTWAALLRRVFAIDVLECARCGGRMRLLCFISDPDVASAILDHLGFPAKPPAALPARAPPEFEPTTY
jgi:hypothetical protein